MNVAIPAGRRTDVHQALNAMVLRERVELLAAENARLRALLNDTRYLTGRVVALLNGRRVDA